jgi:hypothetical protein
MQEGLGKVLRQRSGTCRDHRGQITECSMLGGKHLGGVLWDAHPASRRQYHSAPANCNHLGIWLWCCHTLIIKRNQPSGFLCKTFII